MTGRASPSTVPISTCSDQDQPGNGQDVRGVGHTQRARVAVDHPRLACFTRADLRRQYDQLALAVKLSSDERSIMILANSLYTVKITLTETLDIIDQRVADLFTQQAKL
jgi:hypothetical protein